MSNDTQKNTQNPFGLGDQEGEKKWSSQKCEQCGRAFPPHNDIDPRKEGREADPDFGLGYN